MNVCLHYWSPFRENDCVFSRNEQQRCISFLILSCAFEHFIEFAHYKCFIIITIIIAMCKLKPHYNLFAKSLPEGLTKPLMHALTSTVGVSGSYRGLHFSILLVFT